MEQLFEKHRPRNLEAVIGQDKAVKVCSRLMGQGNRAIWFSGQSGTGKTTLARILAGAFADDLYVREMTGRDLTVEALETICENVRHYPLHGKGHCVIINEAHGLSRNVIERLLQALEAPDLTEIQLWIFTTTRVGQERLFDCQIDAGALMSRCLFIGLGTRGLCPAFAQRAKEIAELEGLNGKPVERYERELKDGKAKGNNFRALLQCIEAGEMME